MIEEVLVVVPVDQGSQTPGPRARSGPPAPRNFAKGSIDLNGPPQRLPLPLATGFVLLLHIFHIIPQVVQSFNVMETVLKSATNGLLPGMDYLPGTGPGAHDRASA